MQGELFPFGQYKGKPIAEVLQDRSYCQWLVAQPDFRDKFTSYYQIVINYLGVPKSTPEHNALQKRFLDEKFCLALGKLCGWRLPHKKIECTRNFGRLIRLTKESSDRNEYEFRKKQDMLTELSEMRQLVEESLLEENDQVLYDGKPFFELKTKFEQGGWDVVIMAESPICRGDCIAWPKCGLQHHKIAVELKTSVGDEYPEILRQMKDNKFHPDFQCLVYDKFNVDGVTLDEVKKIFESEDFKVFSFSDIENACSG